MEQHWKTGLGHERRGGGQERKTEFRQRRSRKRGSRVGNEREIVVLNGNGKLGDGGP